ncbi:MAG TPA: ATP-binding protein, partial [Thermodesulfovibrionales bacterium]|nr:ATP-binding protein [Thermodesulfovibrionales bacterium]
ENSIAAGARRIEVSIEEDRKNDRLAVKIADDGKGMDEDTLKMVADPFYTTKTVRKVGLGLPLLKQSAEECEGSFSITSEKGKGTTTTAVFRLSHIDRKPLGDLGATFVVLIAGNPAIDFSLTYRSDGHVYRFDTSEIRQDLGEIPLHSPAVLKLIRKHIEDGMRKGAAQGA